jgi:hypothetical protein
MLAPQLDVPLALGLLLLLFGKWDSGVTSIYWWQVWWALIWIGPVLYMLLWGMVGKDRHRRNGLFVFLPAGVFVGLWVFEVHSGRTERSPWWMSHALMGLGVYLSSMRMFPGADDRYVRKKAQGLLAAALLFPLIPLSTAQALWKDCWRLRTGSDMAAVFAVLRDQYVLDPKSGRGEDRTVIRDQVAANWSNQTELVIGSADNNADVAYLSFSDGRLASFWLSPD